MNDAHCIPSRQTLTQKLTAMDVRRRSARVQQLEKEAASRMGVCQEEIEGERDVGVYKRRKTNEASKAKAKLPKVSQAASSGSSCEKLVSVDSEKPPSLKLTEKIRLFNKYYLLGVQEEESRVKLLEAAKISHAARDDVYKRPSKRPDLKAVSKMRQNKELLQTTKAIGDIPGIEVGHQFFSRCEMVVIGFHTHWLNGIDYIGQTKQKEFEGYKMPLATAIVLSGQYEDDQDNYEEVVYTGQGGNDLLGKKCQIKDQVMQRGNLGLKNCMEQSVPVRFVRGHRCQSSYVGKVYTYDGLYKVVNYWAEKGISGFTVFKFRLKRLEGQPPLTTNQVHFVRGCIPNSVSDIRGLVCEDISGGLEDIRIPATNLVDDEPIPPPGFTYIKKLKWPKDIAVPPNGPGCNCKGSCFDPKTCTCARLNGFDFPYVAKHGGRLIEPKAVVFECGPNCGCGSGCVNRISQLGIRFRLEVFRTPNKGWGVRSWDYIPSGAPICEYVGRLMKTDQVDPSADTNYVFDIDCLQTMNGLDGRERRLRDVSLPDYLSKGDEKASDSSAPEFCIDGLSCGNVSRFINHSCQPNLFVQCVLSNHHDIKLARVVLMAADNIPPLQELSYDYGYAVDSVLGADGQTKKLACYCGAEKCRKRLY
ncbi:unnamed protein product [Cuscuta epithymum]|uniref:Histone-lysine N-methyltransferase, H3 lysine-9 specific SUVH4 n=1 Tax=Cuscuta epithymum TaxID=186058 RepID=A0AAV0EAC5_9ASTE|nr:unnamed protein product [Cuscuta epithymum]CAH9144500.1 unnamed protein product [Cuscuta epithymum]